jgi:uncharacterized phage protein (TIGR01671 family)
MRTIKFRGLRTNGQGWVYGFYVYRPDGTHLIYLPPFADASQNTYYSVFPESVGQFTGLTDKNGVEIFEGDVLECETNIDVIKCEVLFDNSHCSYCLKTIGKKPLQFPIKAFVKNYLVIGNIHSNPELL